MPEFPRDVQNQKLGRRIAVDRRDRKFAIEAPIAGRRLRRYWNANGWWGDQGYSSECVGYAWAHWLEDGPVTHKGTPPVVQPATIYEQAKLIDEWPGEDYDGTSVRAGAKVLQGLGYITEYRWAFTMPALIHTLLEKGPVVFGSWWYEGMDEPDERGFIRPTGATLGGHAYVLNGINTRSDKVRMKNSWNRTWGHNGHAWISISDLAILLHREGEACLAGEIRPDPNSEAHP